MTDAQAAVAMDRLPWLTDEPRRTPTRARKGGRGLPGAAFAALLAVAGASYWLGTRETQQPVESSLPARPQATVKLPEPSETVEPQAPIADAPEAVPAIPAPQRFETPIRRTRPTTVVRPRTLSPMDIGNSELANTVAEQEGTPAKSESATNEASKPAASEPAKPATIAAPAPAKTAAPQPLRLWPAQESKGADGRLVRIGAFGSREQAKLGWRRMQKAYPAVARLPATVVSDRNSRGKTFYRFQIGTTSQAHSEVLCQRMEKLLRFSCAVVGLPWKAKVER